MQPVPEWLRSDKGAHIFPGSFGHSLLTPSPLPHLADALGWWPRAFLVVSAYLLWSPVVDHHLNRLISFNIFGKKSLLWSKCHFSHSLLVGCFPALGLVILFIQTGTGGNVTYLKFGTRFFGFQYCGAHCPLPGIGSTWHVRWSSSISSQGTISALPSSFSPQKIWHPCNKSCCGHKTSKSFYLLQKTGIIWIFDINDVCFSDPVDPVGSFQACWTPHNGAVNVSARSSWSERAADCKDIQAIATIILH